MSFATATGMYWKAFLVWLGFGLVAFAFGALRELLLTPRLGEQTAHQIGTLAVVAVIAGAAWFFTRRIGVGPAGGFWLGAFWAALTLLFEFGFFHFVRGIAWEGLLADYNFLAGRLWVLVPLAELLAPMAAAQRFRGRACSRI